MITVEPSPRSAFLLEVRPGKGYTLVHRATGAKQSLGEDLSWLIGKKMRPGSPSWTRSVKAFLKDDPFIYENLFSNLHDPVGPGSYRALERSIERNYWLLTYLDSQWKIVHKYANRRKALAFMDKFCVENLPAYLVDIEWIDVIASCGPIRDFPPLDIDDLFAPR